MLTEYPEGSLSRCTCARTQDYNEDLQFMDLHFLPTHSGICHSWDRVQVVQRLE